MNIALRLKQLSNAWLYSHKQPNASPGKGSSKMVTWPAVLYRWLRVGLLALLLHRSGSSSVTVSLCLMYRAFDISGRTQGAEQPYVS